MTNLTRVAHFNGYPEVAEAVCEVVRNPDIDMAVVHDAMPEFERLQKWFRKADSKVGPKPNQRSRELLDKYAPGILHAIA